MSDVPTLQTLVDWANIGVVISLALSFVFGAASIWLSGKLGRLKDAQAEAAQRALEFSLATQQERAANAERSLLELQERQTPRHIDQEALFVALRGKPVGKAVILCDPSVPDSWNPLGMELNAPLSRAGWIVSMMYVPADPTPKLNEGLTKPFPTVYREEITIEGAIEDCEGRDTPYCSLFNAFRAVGVDFQATRADGLEEQTFRILIGPRRLLEPVPKAQ